ncbi:hypothetical protein KBA27_04615 [bacterium]|nr:hypothetical protein [bacterium]
MRNFLFCILFFFTFSQIALSEEPSIKEFEEYQSKQEYLSEYKMNYDEVKKNDLKSIKEQDAKKKSAIGEFKKSNEIYNEVLKLEPNNIEAKLQIAQNYRSEECYIRAINYLDSIEQTPEVRELKARIYLKDLHMPDNASEEVLNINTDTAWEIKEKARRKKAFRFVPGYAFMIQSLSQEFKLDAQRFYMGVEEGVRKNTKLYGNYNIFVYTSGGNEPEHNVVNNIIVGAKGHPVKEWEYDANFGVKIFQFGHKTLLNTDSWLKYNFGDESSIKIGYYRENMEQSYLSSVGRFIDGKFTGRCANDRVYINYTKHFENRTYISTDAIFGFVMGRNLPTNLYYESIISFGKHLYINPNNKYINKFDIEISTDNMRYQYDLLNLYSKSGQLFGGYFSPEFFDATTLKIIAEGKYKHFKYGIEAFGGVQTSISTTQTIPAWGVSPYIKYDINDTVSFYAEYNHYQYADVQRNLFSVYITIRGFKKHAKR